MDVYIARQPILNRHRKLFGYELLFRGGLTNAFPDIEGDVATSKLLTNSFFTFGIDTITGTVPALINFTEELLLKQLPTMFPKDRIIVEILETVEPGPRIQEACADLARKGYTLALDDFVYEPRFQPLVELAKIIKIDFMLTPMEEIEAMVATFSDLPIKLLAEKIETYDEFRRAVDMGFTYFQGYFFSKPEILQSRDIQPSKLNTLQIIAEASKEDLDFDRLEKMVNLDVSISYKLLRYINSAFFKRVNEIKSIRQALVFLGAKEVRRFVSLIAAAELASDKPGELIRNAIIRARLCESLGAASHQSDERVAELFMLGLFSNIDAMLDDSMDNLMEQLPLSEDIKRALLVETGEMADLLRMVKEYEAGNWERFSVLANRLDIQEDQMPECYADALGWADACLSL
jgi:c-di-GMP-related signal transduction protein